MTNISKRSIILSVLEILKRYSDSEHRMFLADILERLEKDYGLCITRKTLRQHLTDLMEAGYPLEYSQGWYYEGTFCEAELNLLFNSVLFNEFLTSNQQRELLNKIKNMGSVYFTPKAFPASEKNANHQFLFTLETLQSAIDAMRQVEFQYAQYDVDKKLHPRMDEGGTPHLYVFNPYRIVIANSRHYVIGNIEKYENVAHFRLDRILECRILETPAKAQRNVRGLEAGLQPLKYIAGHAYMFSGSCEPVRLRIKRAIVGDVLDWFGMEVRFENTTQDTTEVVVESDPATIQLWLKQYDEFAERIECTSGGKKHE